MTTLKDLTNKNLEKVAQLMPNFISKMYERSANLGKKYTKDRRAKLVTQQTVNKLKGVSGPLSRQGRDTRIRNVATYGAKQGAKGGAIAGGTAGLVLGNDAFKGNPDLVAASGAMGAIAGTGAGVVIGGTSGIVGGAVKEALGTKPRQLQAAMRVGKGSGNKNKKPGLLSRVWSKLQDFRNPYPVEV